MICETCLGGNPYVRMIKLPGGHKLCKISGNVYQGFRWKAGPNGRYKETVISIVVAKERNICQCCLNDMRYGLPAGVRDAMMRRSQQAEGQAMTELPRSHVGTQFYYQNIALNGTTAENSIDSFANQQDLSSSKHQLERFSNQKYKAGNDVVTFTFASSSNDLTFSIGSGNKIAANSHLTPLASSNSKTAFRNLPKLCSFWLNGSCSRVIRGTCPFRPCCGATAFVFPELASNHKEAHEKLKSQLKEFG